MNSDLPFKIAPILTQFKCPEDIYANITCNNFTVDDVIKSCKDARSAKIRRFGLNQLTCAPA
jgi:hypothetical protein